MKIISHDIFYQLKHRDWLLSAGLQETYEFSLMHHIVKFLDDNDNSVIEWKQRGN